MSRLVWLNSAPEYGDEMCYTFQYLNATLAFVLGHGIITSLVIVFTGFLINKEKIKAVPFISRFLFMFILLGASSALSMAITSWLN